MSPSAAPAPERAARRQIDAALEAAGWVVQNRDEMNVYAGLGVAVREFKLARGHGYADYLLFVDGKAVGVLEAKKVGHTLSGVEPQLQRYAAGLPAELEPPIAPLRFATSAPARSPSSSTCWTPTRAAGASSTSTGPRPWPTGSRPPPRRLGQGHRHPHRRR